MNNTRDRSVRRHRIDTRLAAAVTLLGIGIGATHAMAGAKSMASAPESIGPAVGDASGGYPVPPPQESAGPLVHVDRNAPAGGDGSSWLRAFRNVQDALAYARTPGSSVNQILVAGGVYRPDVGGGETPGDRMASFELINRIEMLGGFDGYGAGNPYNRDIEQFETILSGDLAQNDLPGRVNNGENSFTVVRAEALGSTAILDGFTISGGNANGPDTGQLELIRGGGMWVQGASPRVIDCTFKDNFASFHGAGMYNRTNSQTAVEGCSFRDNFAGLRGGAIFNAFGSDSDIVGCEFRNNTAGTNGGAINSHDSSLDIADCGFFDNSGGEGAAIHAGLSSTLTIDRSEFARNIASIGGGAIRVTDECSLIVRDGTFRENEATDGAAIFISDLAPAASITNALFVRNDAVGFGGAVYDASASTFVNCAFSRNSAFQFGTGLGGGAAYLTDSSTFINCTMSRNDGCGLRSSTIGATLVNSIVWGNDPAQILDEGAASSVSNSDIQGDWSGPGSDNMNAEPCFVESTDDNIRLATGSPCLNEGDNAAIPAGVTTDLDGNPRIFGGTVDLGAYEGSQDAIPLIAEDLDLDDGQRAVLVPSGEDFNPLEFAAVSFFNRSGTDNATVRVVESYKVLYPAAQGYSELGPIMQIETSLADGDTFATIYIPFVEEALPGVDVLDLDLTYWDAATGNWGLAVSRNVGASPGHAGVIGDRSVVVSDTGGGFTNQLGDYGVFVHSVSRKGIVWANVDHAADFGFGVALCPADADQPPDGSIDMGDMMAVLRWWALGAAEGPYDINDDGRIDGIDVALILGNWGSCLP